MSVINEIIVTGNIFRKLIDGKNNIWQRKSFWTKASDVEFDDGTVLELKFNTLSNTVSNKNGSYDSSISQINTKISNIESKNSSRDTKISNLETKVSNIEANNSSQDTNVSNISTKVDSIEKKIGDYSFKVMSLSDYNALQTKDSKVLYFCY